MATQKPLVIDNGTTQQIANADTLLVGVAVEPSTGTALRVGAAAGTTITTFPGPVRLDGDVTTVGGTTFTTDATFEGNVTFGNGPADTVTFAATTTVVSNINFATPVAYKITNLANGTNPNDAVNVSQLSALVTGVSAVTATAPLLSSGGPTPDISISTVGASNGDVLTYNGAAWAAAAPAAAALTVGTTAIVSGAANRVLFEGAGNVLQESANLTWDGSAFTVNGVVSVGEGSAPAATAAFGKLWANSAADARPYWVDDTGQSFNLTLDRFNTLTPAASVAINTSPALPIFNSLALNQNTTFTTSNLGNGRSASVRVVCDGTTRTLTFPGTWTWLGSGPPADLAANDVGYLSITAYGATDADVVAAWSYENMPAVVTGSGTATQIAFFTGASTIGSETAVGSDSFTWNSTDELLGVRTASPSNVVDVRAGALNSGQSALSVTGTLSSTVATQRGVTMFITGAGSGAQQIEGVIAGISGGGYTGSGSSIGANFYNESLGTGNQPFAQVYGNLAVRGQAYGASATGHNVGFYATAQNALRNFGFLSVQNASSQANGYNVGVATSTHNAAASGVRVGGFFSIDTTFLPAEPTLTSAALIADNTSTTDPIFLARDSGTTTFSIGNNGVVLARNTADSVTAFSVQDSGGTTLLDVDTTNDRVGVLTAAPVAALDLASGQLAIPDGTAAAPAIAFRDDLNAGFFSPSNDIVGVAVNGTEIARLQQSGAGSTPALLMGTSTVLGAITVDSSDPSVTAGVAMLAHGAAGTTIQESYRGGQFTGIRTRGTKAAPTQVGTDDGLWSALGAGYTSAAGYNYGALITFKAEQAYTATASGGRIEFHTTANGTDGFTTLGSATTERMRIANDGKVFVAGVATTNTHTFNISTSGTNPAFAIASGGRIHYYDGSQPTDGQVLIGDTAGGNFAKATITAGTGISVTNGAGSITIAATGAAASSSTDITGYVAQEALNAGDLVRFVDDAGTPKVQKADATNTDARLNPAGFAVAAASAGAAVTVRVAGVADVPAARFDAAPGVANVGQRVFMSTTSGQVTITAPSASGDILQRVGVLVDGSANPKVLVQVGDPTLL